VIGNRDNTWLYGEYCIA